MTGPWIAAFVVQWVLVLLLGGLVLGLLRRVSAHLERVQGADTVAVNPRFGLQPGARFASFTGYDVDGRPAPFEDLVEGSDHSALLFLGPECPACRSLIDQLSLEGWTEASDGRLVVILSDEPASSDLAKRMKGLTVLLDRGQRLAGLFNTDVSPNLFAVSREKHVLRQELPLDLAAVRAVASPTGGSVRLAPRPLQNASCDH